MGTNRRDTSTWPVPGFSRSEEHVWTPPQLRCSTRSIPSLCARQFQGTRTLKQKRKLFPDLPTASPGHVGLSRRACAFRRGPDVKRFRDRVPEWGPDSLSPDARPEESHNKGRHLHRVSPRA
ncbi:hypothetical protein R5R35_013554 [Gryllus longicercus]